MQVLAVFILYVRCAGCDPADPGVHQSKRSARAKHAALKAKEKLVSNNDAGKQASNDSHDESDKNSQTVMTIRSETSSPDQNFCAQWLCLPFVCCRKEDSMKLNSGEQLLYCSICEAEVRLRCLLYHILYLTICIPKLPGVSGR